MSQIIVELQDSMGSDASIANAAWTSTYDKDKRDVKYDDEEKVNNLVPRLIRDGHGTPIESVVFRFWMRIPIYTDRQIMTHRIASHNGLSGRYRTMPNDWYHIPDDCKNILDHAISNSSALIKRYDDICETAFQEYNNILTSLKREEKANNITNAEYKRCREVLRGMLPVSGMTERTTMMNLRSFANFIRQRLDAHAQPEIQLVAQKMLEEVEKANICPIAINTLKEVKWKI